MLQFYLSLLETEEERLQFEKIYLDYRDLMYYVANKILKNDQLAEDAVHQSFLRIIESKNKFNEISCPKTKSFLVIVCRNVSFDMINKNKRIVDMEDQFDLIPDERTTEEEVIKNADAEHMAKIISELPNIYRDVFNLYYSNELSITEIAKLLKISKEVVYKRIQRARAKLAQVLNEEGSYDLR